MCRIICEQQEIPEKKIKFVLINYKLEFVRSILTAKKALKCFNQYQYQSFVFFRYVHCKSKIICKLLAINSVVMFSNFFMLKKRRLQNSCR